MTPTEFVNIGLLILIYMVGFVLFIAIAYLFLNHKSILGGKK